MPEPQCGGMNEGMQKLTDDIRALGFRWDSYTEAGAAACNGANGSSEGFETQDASLFIDEWKLRVYCGKSQYYIYILYLFQGFLRH